MAVTPAALDPLIPGSTQRSRGRQTATRARQVIFGCDRRRRTPPEGGERLRVRPGRQTMRSLPIAANEKS